MHAQRNNRNSLFRTFWGTLLFGDDHSSNILASIDTGQSMPAGYSGSQSPQKEMFPIPDQDSEMLQRHLKSFKMYLKHSQPN